MAYRDLWKVERGFRELKSSLEIDPTYHWTPRRVKAHVFVCFLALLMETSLKRRFKEARVLAEYSGAIEALSGVRIVKIGHRGKVFCVRDDIEGSSFLPFKVLGIKPPPKVVEVSSKV